MARRKAVRARPSGKGSRERSLTVMDRIFLSVICAAVVLLVTAFALATPSLKSDGAPEKTILLRAAER
jgi:type VI protein secretion system component VasF